MQDVKNRYKASARLFLALDSVSPWAMTSSIGQQAICHFPDSLTVTGSFIVIWIACMVRTFGWLWPILALKVNCLIMLLWGKNITLSRMIRNGSGRTEKIAQPDQPGTHPATSRLFIFRLKQSIKLSLCLVWMRIPNKTNQKDHVLWGIAFLYKISIKKYFFSEPLMVPLALGNCSPLVMNHSRLFDLWKLTYLWGMTLLGIKKGLRNCI